MRELIVDSFAGGGGASTGIENALGRSPDIAINHNERALAMHERNHPDTVHFREDVWAVDPRAVCNGRPVGLMWLSPDCTFFSKARGGAPFRDRDKARRRRGLASVAIRWAKSVRPRVIVMENVAEFEDWCPLLETGLPDWSRKGSSFRRWKKSLENCGYVVELRQLRACDFGAPTTRKRLFIIARCDGEKIVWPAPTHGPGLLPFRTAADCIDWSIPCPSIFERAKPLVDNTLRRIARGIRKYVIDAAEPFIVPISEPLRTTTTARRGEFALVSAGLIHRGNGERVGQEPRIYDIRKPHPTVVAGGAKTGVVAAFLAKHYGGNYQGAGADAQMPLPTVTAVDHHAVVSSHLLKLHGSSLIGQEMSEPAPTIRAQGTHLAEVRAFLVKYFGTDQDPQLGLPMHTVTTKDRFGLVTIRGTEYVIVDIGMRMLTPRELFNAQGFPPGYEIDFELEPGRPMPKTAQVEACGNSVCPPLAAALVRANFEDAFSMSAVA